MTAGVVGGHPLQAPQHVGDVRAEHAAVPVTLVHDHVVQAAEELTPPGVSGQQHVMQHVRGGEQVVRVGAGALAISAVGVTVHHGGGHPRDAECLDGA